MKAGEIRNYINIRNKPKVTSSLKEMVETNGGRARIFVHPGFLIKDNQRVLRNISKKLKGDLTKKEIEGLKSVQKSIKENIAFYNNSYLKTLNAYLFNAPKDKMIPTFLLVEHPELGKMEKHLEKIKDKIAHPVILVPTFEKNPYAYNEDVVTTKDHFKLNLDNEDMQKRYEALKELKTNKTIDEKVSSLVNEHVDKHNKRLVNWLMTLGVKKLQVGGELTAYEGDFSTLSDQIEKQLSGEEINLHEHYMPYMHNPKVYLDAGCVGAFIKYVLKHSQDRIKVIPLRAGTAGIFNKVLRARGD